MNDRDLMEIARNILAVKLLSETTAEALVLDDGTEDLVSDMDIVSGCAERVALLIERSQLGFPEVLKRAQRVNEARAQILAQKQGGES